MLRIGIIGAGRIGKVHLESISYHVKNAVVTAVADPFMNDETRDFIKGFGVEHIYSDYKEIINDKDIDAVLFALQQTLTLIFQSKPSTQASTFSAKSPLTTRLQKSKKLPKRLKLTPNASSR